MTGAVEWQPRLHEETGVVHSAAAVRWSTGEYSGVPTTIIGYQTRCRGSYMIHDEYIIDTIPADSPEAEQVTCLVCLAAEP